MGIPFVQDIAVVPGGDIVGAQRTGVLLEGAELDLAVAQHVGIGGAAAGVLLEEVCKNALCVLFGKIDGIIRNSDFVAHPPYVLVVRFGGAAAVFALLFPIDHVQTYDVVTLLL